MPARNARLLIMAVAQRVNSAFVRRRHASLRAAEERADSKACVRTRVAFFHQQLVRKASDCAGCTTDAQALCLDKGFVIRAVKHKACRDPAIAKASLAFSGVRGRAQCRRRLALGQNKACAARNASIGVDARLAFIHTTPNTRLAMLPTAEGRAGGCTAPRTKRLGGTATAAAPEHTTAPVRGGATRRPRKPSEPRRRVRFEQSPPQRHGQCGSSRDRLRSGGIGRSGSSWVCVDHQLVKPWSLGRSLSLRRVHPQQLAIPPGQRSRSSSYSCARRRSTPSTPYSRATTSRTVSGAGSIRSGSSVRERRHAGAPGSRHFVGTGEWASRA